MGSQGAKTAPLNQGASNPDGGGQTALSGLMGQQSSSGGGGGSAVSSQQTEMLQKYLSSLLSSAK